MASEEKHHFLDAERSDDDVQDSNSDDELQKGGRTAKRHRLHDDSDFNEVEKPSHGGTFHSIYNGDGDTSDAEKPHSKSDKPNDCKRSLEPDDEGDTGQRPSVNSTATPKLAKLLTKKNLVATEAAIKKSGVVYVSRIPPFMKPAKLRSLLEVHGKINRIFLAPEDSAAHRRRVRAGGNKKKMFTEGWVEFVRKKDAKRVCELLNAQTIGGKKGAYYRDDLWTLVYLKGFKWHNLTEQIAAENAERSNRMMAEIRRTTRENKEFVRNVEKAKMLDGMRTKKAQKKRSGEGDAVFTAEASHTASHDRARTFKQVSLAKRNPPLAQSELRGVASRIF